MSLREEVLAALAIGAALGAEEKSIAELLKSREDSAQEKARAILAQVLAFAKQAAKAGEPEVIVMTDLNDGHDFHKPQGWSDQSVCKPEWLIPEEAAALVFAELADAGLSPSIEDGLNHDFDYGEFYIAIPTKQRPAVGEAPVAGPDKNIEDAQITQAHAFRDAAEERLGALSRKASVIT
jgi:hypothetical protein